MENKLSNIEPLLLDATAVGLILGGISRSNIYRLLSSGKLPRPIKLGGRSLWRRDELQAWCAAGCPSIYVWEAQKGGKR